MMKESIYYIVVMRVKIVYVFCLVVDDVVVFVNLNAFVVEFGFDDKLCIF